MVKASLIELQVPTRLKTLMDERGLNQCTLGRQTGIRQALISKYLLGQAVPGAKNLIALSTALDCSIEYLLGVREADYDVSKQ